MKNIFLVYGNEPFLINNFLDSIKNKHQNGQVSTYDLRETNVSVLLEDASMISLFNDEKIIIGYNAEFLSATTTKDNINHDTDRLSAYLDNPNPNNIIVFATSSDKLDKRKTIVKKLLDKAEVKECNSLTDDEKAKWARDLFTKNNYQINFKALNTLIDRSGTNLFMLNNECEKLMHYKIDTKVINEADIEEMIIKYDCDNIFALTDAVVKRNVALSLELYQELLKCNEEPIKIIVMLANQFRLIFQVKRLHAKGFSDTQIASDLAVHPYRVKLANEINLTPKEALRYLNDLADLDEGIKMGNINKDVGLEMFLLKL